MIKYWSFRNDPYFQDLLSAYGWVLHTYKTTISHENIRIMWQIVIVPFFLVSFWSLCQKWRFEKCVAYFEFLPKIHKVWHSGHSPSMEPIITHFTFDHKLILVVWLPTNTIKSIFFIIWRHVDIILTTGSATAHARDQNFGQTLVMLVPGSDFWIP